MVDQHHEPDEAALAVVARHALHDEELIAAFAAGGVESEDDATRASSLVERCPACRELHDDLAAIGAGLRADAQGTIAAPRDFRLSVDDARRLGGTIVTRGFLQRLRRSMDGFARPVGASMAALGIVGLLVSNLSFGGAALAPVGIDSAAAPTSAPAPMGGELTGTAGPAESTGRTTAYGPFSTKVEVITEDGSGGGRNLADTTSNPRALVFGGSLALLIVGVALLFLGLRRGRRRRTGPPETP